MSTFGEIRDSMKAIEEKNSNVLIVKKLGAWHRLVQYFNRVTLMLDLQLQPECPWSSPSDVCSFQQWLRWQKRGAVYNLQTDQNFRYVCDSSFIRYVMRNQWTTLSFVFRPQLEILWTLHLIKNQLIVICCCYFSANYHPRILFENLLQTNLHIPT